MRPKHGSDSTCPQKMEVLRISATYSELEFFTVYTLTDDKTEWKHIDARTVELERWLGHTPNLQWWHRERRIDLNYLSLFDRDPCAPGSAASESSEPDESYYIYKCDTETPTELPRNTLLEKLGGRPAYGDAFVFKVRYRKDFHGERKAVFDSMDGFLEDFEERGDAFQMLASMARW